jgi:hypothetical protein
MNLHDESIKIENRLPKMSPLCISSFALVSPYVCESDSSPAIVDKSNDVSYHYDTLCTIDASQKSTTIHMMDCKEGSSFSIKYMKMCRQSQTINPDYHHCWSSEKVIDDDTLSFISSDDSLGDDDSSSLFSDSDSGKGYISVETLPYEILLYMVSFLDVNSVCVFRLVSRLTRCISSKDGSGWRHHCQTLWSRKSYVLKESRLLYSCQKAMEAYMLSIYDANHREELYIEELCFNERTGDGFIWNFRFKEAAGSNWTSHDPWWLGGDARKMVFLFDGTVQEVRECEHSGKFSFHPPFQKGGLRGTIESGEKMLSSTSCSMTWRFVDQPMEFATRPLGSYIRLTVDGRDVPTYVVHRSPNRNWGFIIESCWAIYSSTHIPRRRQLTHTLLEQLRMKRRGVWESAGILITNNAVERPNSQSQFEICPSDCADSSYFISTTLQWREALLYNYGAVTLPEGDNAKETFDEIWSRATNRFRASKS